MTKGLDGVAMLVGIAVSVGITGVGVTRPEGTHEVSRTVIISRMRNMRCTNLLQIKVQVFYLKMHLHVWVAAA
jgi:hypothetical protein